MINLKAIISVSMVVTVMLLNACSGDDPVSSVAVSDPVNCYSPCLLETPTLDINTITAATGATVNVSFTIKGDLAALSQIQIDVMPVDTSNGQGRLTWVTIQDPAQALITQPIVIASGSVTGEFYLKFSFSGTETNEFGDATVAIYDLSSDISTSNYSFEQHIVGEAQAEVITDLVIPFITINP